MADTSLKPTEKVQAGGYSGAAAIVLLWGARQAGIDLEPEVAAAITLLIAGAGAWLKTEGAGWFRRGDGEHRA